MIEQISLIDLCLEKSNFVKAYRDGHTQLVGVKVMLKGDSVCVVSHIRSPIGRHAHTMLIFKSLGCLFKVSNGYLPLEEFS